MHAPPPAVITERGSPRRATALTTANTGTRFRRRAALEAAKVSNERLSKRKGTATRTPVARVKTMVGPPDDARPDPLRGQLTAANATATPQPARTW
jgi:hypothetical protein